MRSVPLVLLAGIAVGCASSSIEVRRGVDDPDLRDEVWDASHPDRMVERLGEPDEWRDEKVGGSLRMTAIWNCTDGQRREVTWRLQSTDAGGQRWVVTDDVTKPGECP